MFASLTNYLSGPLSPRLAPMDCGRWLRTAELWWNSGLAKVSNVLLGNGTIMVGPIRRECGLAVYDIILSIMGKYRKT